ncbi:MAG TPA: hypothetical protein VML55_09835 [Planctomycetaceae bacterium]|nr:hypothetical protein [Planctomycetaceae bacterium]
MPYVWAAVLTAALAATASAQTGAEWEAYQRRLVEQRRQAAERYDQWQQHRDERYDRWRQPPEGRFDGEAIDLPDGVVPGGRYSLDLPFGRISVNVQSPQGGRGRGWLPGNYSSAYELVRKLQDPLRDLQILFQRAGQQELRNQILESRTASERLKEALAAQQPPEVIHERFVEFDRFWHQAWLHISQRQDLGAAVQQKANSVNDYDNLLHEVIRIAPHEPYDRVTGLALARQLMQATEGMLDEVERGSRDVPWAGAILRNAQRVHGHARDLFQTIYDNAGFVAVQDDFAQFDRAWHEFTERVDGARPLGRGFHEMRRYVWKIHNDLHSVLTVDTPIYVDHALAARIARQIERSAEHLAEDLRYESGRDARWLAYDARELSRAAGMLADAARGSERDLSSANRGAVEAWETLSGGVDRSQPPISPHARRVVEELGGQMVRLAEALGVAP